jgi:ABC-2 type transport system permease protein
MKHASSISVSESIAAKTMAGRRGASQGSLLASLCTLYALTFRQHLHGRRWIVMTILFLLPPAFALLIRATTPDMPVVGNEFIMAFMFIPQALLPLIALVYASGIIQDEQEEQTLTYLLIRPIPRWAIYVVKLLATLTTTVLLTSIFTALTYAVVYVGSGAPMGELLSRCARAMAIHGATVVCYCCLFGLISLLTRWALIVCVLDALFFEVLVANLPFSVRLVTVIFYARLIAYRSMPFVVTENRHSEDIAAVIWQFDVRNDPNLADLPSMQTCLIVLAVASLAFTAIAALICSRREFYVKTPESN